MKLTDIIPGMNSQWRADTQWCHIPMLLTIFLSVMTVAQGRTAPVLELGAGPSKGHFPGGFFEYCIAGSEEEPPDSLYRLMTEDVFVLGKLEAPLRLRAHLRNSSRGSLDHMLEIGNPLLDGVGVLILSGQDTLASAFFSDRVPFGERAYRHRNYVVPFSIPPGGKASIHIEVLPQSGSLFIPFRIISAQSFERSSASGALLLGGLIGMYGIFILFIVSLFFILRRRLFLHYALINLLILFFCVFDTGFGFQYLWPSVPFLQERVLPLISFAYLLSIVTFTRAFFSTGFKYPGADRFLKLLMWLTLAVYASAFLLYELLGFPLAVPLLLVSILFATVAATISVLGIVTYVQSGRREGFWFLLLFTAYLLLFMLVLEQRGYLGVRFIDAGSILHRFLPLFTGTPHSLFLMMLAEMFIVATLISLRLQAVLDEYNVSQRRIEAISRDSIKAFTQGQEEERVVLAEQLQKRIGSGLHAIETGMKEIDGGGIMSVPLSQLTHVRSELRQIGSDYVPDWSGVGLKAIISRVFSQLQIALPNVRVMLEIDTGVSRLKADDLVKLNLYRVLQEACNNIIKHAAAMEVHARFEAADGTLYVLIEDDGLGFDFGQSPGRRGIGMRNMETRVKALNGSWKLSSTAGVGARIEMEIPVETKKSAI